MPLSATSSTTVSNAKPPSPPTLTTPQATEREHRLVVDGHPGDARGAEENARLQELVIQQSRDILLFIRLEDGRILDANPAATAAYGYEREEILALTVRDLRAPATAALIEPQMSEAFERGLLFESVHRRKDGSVFPVEVSSRGALLGGAHTLVSVVRDITERKQVEEALRRKEEEARAQAIELTAILNCVGDGVIVYDRAGRIVRSNPAADEILRIPASSRALSVQERAAAQYVVTDEDGRRVEAGEMIAFRAAVRGEEVKRAVNLVQSKGMEPRWLMMSAKPLFVAGQHTGAVLSMTDITDRKRAERSLHDANEALKEADRRKDEFIGMLSHELRNRLAPIRNSSFILRRADPGSPQARRAQDAIERQTAHLTRLVDDLLDVTRIARGKIELRREVVDVRDLVLRAGDDFRSAMDERGLRFQLKVPSVPVMAHADPTRLAQVVGNLLHNAVKFTPRSGTVALALTPGGGDAEIRVSDNGAGIEAELLPIVFEPFVQGARTLARTDGGLGLGLALVKGIVDLHGGSVSASSAGTGQGAEFVVRLPLAGRAAASTAPASADGLAARRRHVLIVDDNVDAAQSFAEIVALLGHSADVAYDGPTAIERARAHPPDVVLCDLGLPGMSGYEVAQALRASATQPVQLVAISGYAQPEDVKRAIEAGFDAHVAKPCDPQKIQRLLE